MDGRVQRGIRWFKSAMVLLLITVVIKVLFAFGSAHQGESIARAVLLLVGGTVVLGGGAYLIGWVTGSNVRVNPNEVPSSSLSTSEIEVSTRRPRESSVPSSANVDTNHRSTADSSSFPTSPTSAQKLRFDPATDEVQERIYDAIGLELEHGPVDRATWTRAFAEAEGNESRAKARYIAIRFARILAAEQIHIANPSAGTSDEQRAPQSDRASRKTSVDVGVSPTERANLSKSMQATQIRLAVRNRDQATVIELVRSNSRLVNVSDSGGVTPLMIAVQNNDFDMVKLLLRLGADASVANHDGKTAREIANDSGSPGVVRLLRQG